jgi:O-antigen/teichoic acid export membrane protein
MFQALLVAVVLIPFAVAVFVLRGVRRADEDRRLKRWRIQRRQWLAAALFLLTFAAGDLLVTLVYGQAVYYLPVIFAATVFGVVFMVKARATPGEPRGP